jgi:uncharacterized glyoxalase superfamily protein PhnB
MAEIHMSVAPIPESDTAAQGDTGTFHGRSLEASLTVRDLEKSLAWYHDVLGFAIDRRYEREGKLIAVALRGGNVRLLIGQDDGAKGWDRTKGEGISLQITTEQNVDEIAGRIQARGGALALGPTDSPWGTRMFRLQDPDGFKLTISSGRPA